MSYDVSLVIDAGGKEPAALVVLDENYTWNVAPMFMESVGSTPNDWDGKSAFDVATICARILRDFELDPEKFQRLNPENGWGSFEGAKAFIAKIKIACEAAPKATFVCN